MKVSINTLKFIAEKYKTASDPVPEGIDTLLQKIGAQLGGIETITEVGKKYEGVVIVRVVSCEPHPNADRLKVCLIDDGSITPDVNRDDKGLVQVVCGAPNVEAGVTVAWLPPGAIVPSSFDTDPFVLEARELRGVVSNGMLASPKELAISDSHEGLLLIDDEVKPGTMFADQYGLRNDVVIDIENKMFTHRPDCFGWIGVAREIAGIQGQTFHSPDWYKVAASISVPVSHSLPLEVRNEIPELVPRFTAITMSNITVGPSPVWLQVRLSRHGHRPINNIVDFTNFFMLETGQPLHAYDYDKVRAQDPDAEQATLVIRKPHDGEKLRLLNSKEVEPRKDAILIATATKAIGLGGVMGGADTEVDENTKNIILECANFDMYSIRRTSMASGIFTDAVTRFNKGQSPLQNMAVLAKIVDEIQQVCGGIVAGPAIDNNHIPREVIERESLYPDITVSAGFINQRLGVSLGADDMAQLLKNVECHVQVDGDNITVRAPFWRTDIEIPEDIVEEVGRLYGFDHLPLVLPTRTLEPARKDQLLAMKSEVRETLSRMGANELLTYSFVHGNLLEVAGQKIDLAFKLSNALSPDLQYYRLSLTPSLLDKVHTNIKAGFDEFALFEIGKAHLKGEVDPFETTVPKEVNTLSLVYSAKKPQAGAAYYQAQRYLMDVLIYFQAQSFIRVEPLAGADLYNNPWIEQMTAPYEPRRSAVLRDEQGLIWGVVGEFKASVRRALKLPDYTAGFELDPLLFLQVRRDSDYQPLPKYPKITQDITLKVKADLSYQELYVAVYRQLIATYATTARFTLEPRMIYQKDDDTAHKQITLRLEVASYEKTLTDAEVNTVLDEVTKAIHESTRAERV